MTSSPSLLSLPPEIICLIINLIEVEDIVAFALLCKYVHQCSGKRLMEHKNMRTDTMIHLDLTSDDHDVEVVERLIQFPRAAFYARYLCIIGNTNVLKTIKNHKKSIRGLLRHCCDKSSMKMWRLALRLQSPQLMLFLILRLAPRITKFRLIDELTPQDPYSFPYLDELWATVPTIIQPQCNIKTVWFEKVELDSRFLASLLRFMPPLETFCWDFDKANNTHSLSWTKILQEHSRNSLHTFACVGCNLRETTLPNGNIEFPRDFQSLRAIQLSGSYSFKPLVNFLPRSIETIYIEPFESEDSGSLFQNFELKNFPNLRSILLIENRHMMFDELDEYVFETVQLEKTHPTTDRFKDLFKLRVSGLFALNPRVAHSRFWKWRTNIHGALLDKEKFAEFGGSRFLDNKISGYPVMCGCRVKRDNLPSVLIAFKLGTNYEFVPFC